MTAVNQINSWVSDQTNQKIPSILSVDVVDNLTRLILVNAVYFKSDWIEQFDKSRTQEADFKVAEDNTIKVPMMHMPNIKLYCGIHKELNCMALELPYKNLLQSMFVLLPDDKVTSLQQLESSLTAEHLIRARNVFGIRDREVNVWLPRFKMDTNINLKGTLSNMGMNDLFESGKADLSGIDGTQELYISEALHRAFVEVNEEGAEAGAATALIAMCRCESLPEDPIDFKADHPFLFFIQDNVTESILFFGRFTAP